VEVDTDSEDEEEDKDEVPEMHLWRASLVPLNNGLRHLLNLRALTSLQLPWIEPREVEALRQLAEQTGRTSLFIERIVPLSRRSLLQRHWIDAATLDDEAF
jgi:hypothetical protein